MSTPRTPSEGQVVYRRVSGQETPPRKREPRFDPALLPLAFGFAVLLLLILTLGNLSVRRLEDTSRQSLQLEQMYAARARFWITRRALGLRLMRDMNCVHHLICD